MPAAQKKKRPGHKPEKKVSSRKINSANEPPSRPGPKRRGRDRGVKGAGKNV